MWDLMVGPRPQDYDNGRDFCEAQCDWLIERVEQAREAVQRSDGERLQGREMMELIEQLSVTAAYAETMVAFFGDVIREKVHKN